MRVIALALGLFALLALASATVYFKDDFNDAAWETRWVKSQNKVKEGTAGDWKWTTGKHFGDENDKGIQTNPDARFFQLSAEIKDKFSNKGKELVIQYQHKNEQNLDCGGGYIKLLPSGLDQSNFHGESPYNIMFGPDKCGSTSRVHVIFTYKGKNHLIKKTIDPKSDQLSHVYTLHVLPNNSYEVLIDKEQVAHGSLLEDWDFLPAKTIKDPSVSKPADWVDEEYIDDPEDKKPEDWDKEPATIADPEAKKPEDWDDELDGEWEAPQISNPEYKGEWKPKRIKNPAYKGVWVHPEIPNPEYKEDSEIYAFDDNKYLGFELWQVTSGTIIDNVIVTDSLTEAFDFADSTWGKIKAGEKAALEKTEKEEKEKREKEQEEAKAKESKKEEPEEDEDDDEEEEKTVKAEKDEL